MLNSLCSCSTQICQEKKVTLNILKKNPKKYASWLHIKTVNKKMCYQNCVNHSIVINWNALRNCQNSGILNNTILNTFYVQSNFASHWAGIRKKNGEILKPFSLFFFFWAGRRINRRINTAAADKEEERNCSLYSAIEISRLSTILQWSVLDKISRDVQDPGSPSSYC